MLASGVRRQGRADGAAQVRGSAGWVHERHAQGGGGDARARVEGREARREAGSDVWAEDGRAIRGELAPGSAELLPLRLVQGERGHDARVLAAVAGAAVQGVVDRLRGRGARARDSIPRGGEEGPRESDDPDPEGGDRRGEPALERDARARVPVRPTVATRPEDERKRSLSLAPQAPRTSEARRRRSARSTSGASRR